MEYRTLGKTEWKVSVIGFGAWGIGGQWGAVDDATAIATIRAAFDAGVNFFDTADAYGHPPGRSEELVGRALRDVRDKVFIATKVGNFARRFGHPLPFNDPLHVELCCDASLHRLGVDRIDLYQSHLGTTEHVDEFLEGFDRLIRKGKIRAMGVSTDSLETVQAYHRDGRCAAVQLDYSYLNRNAERGILPWCLEHQIGTLIRGPLAKGVATGKFTRASRFDDSVRGGWNTGEARENLLEELAVVDQVRELERPGRNLATLALQFVLAHPAVTCAIPGAKSPQQAQANAAAGRQPISPADLSRIQAASAGRRSRLAR